MIWFAEYQFDSLFPCFCPWTPLRWTALHCQGRSPLESISLRERIAEHLSLHLLLCGDTPQKLFWNAICHQWIQ
jgi:hypothetical protein